MGRFTAGVAEVLRVTFRREALPPPPARATPPRPPLRLARLLAPEPLPAPDQAGPPRPVEAPRARGALSLLLAPEPLPPDLPTAPRRGGRWLAWILFPESLEP